MRPTPNFNSKSNTIQTAACSECQAGRCCGHCWCCYDRDRLALELALAAENAPHAVWEHFGPGPEQCSFCTRPADPTLKTADWPMCSLCYAEFGAFDPVLDGAALQQIQDTALDVAEGMRGGD